MECDSDSSVDDYLVTPSQIDLSSDFFNTKNNSVQPNSSNKSAEEHNRKSNKAQKNKNIFKGNTVDESATSTKSFGTTSGGQYLKYEQFNKVLDDAKCAFQQLNNNNSSNNSESFDISTLLALGEVNDEQQQQIPQDVEEASDSDEWEEVEEKQKEICDIEVVAKESAPIKMNSKVNNFLVLLKTAINKKKRDAQLNLHKTHVLCLIGHGNYVNTILNMSHLQKICNQYIPGIIKRSTAKTKNKNYFQELVKWYQRSVKLDKSAKQQSSLEKLPSMAISLALQAKTQTAISRRDYVFLFCLLLRSIGLQCRLVINLATAPIRPQLKDLCPLKVIELENSFHFTVVEACEELRFKSDASDKKRKTISENDDKSTVKVKRTKTTENIEQDKKCSNVSKRPLRTINKNLSQKKMIKLSPLSIQNNTKSLSVRVKRLQADNYKKESGPLRKSERKPFFNENSMENTTKLKSKSKNTKPLVDDKKTNINESSASQKNSNQETNTTRNTRSKLKLTKIPQLDGSNRKPTTKSDESLSSDDSDFEIPVANKNRKKRNVHRKSYKLDTESDSDFEMSSPPKKLKRKSKAKRPQATTTRSTKENNIINSNKKSIDYWIEVYCPADKTWLSIDIFQSKINDVEHIKKFTSKPLRYVLAWNNDNTIKDISAKYCKNWNTTVRLLRVQQEWLDKTLKPYQEEQYKKQMEEDKEFCKISLYEQLPKVLSEYKNHPLYALERHLLKFEVIYPAKSLILGYVRNEAVYSRDCVHVCHSRKTWYKQARVVKLGEKPYRIVKDRPQWDPKTKTLTKNLALEIFGLWQTEPYEPPVAENGIVPRNAYGNVELFKPEMLPKNTVHLRLPGLNRTCKKMGIDCANVFIGWDLGGGKKRASPFDGYVICEEFKNRVIKQWEIDQKNAKNKEEEKRFERIYGNWKKLIKGLFIRERLQRKYEFKKGL